MFGDILCFSQATMVALATAGAVAAEAALPAFPGAEGFGSTTRGGRGGQVLFVSTLEDYARGKCPIPGSLRAAIETKGPRAIVFRVGGTIELMSS